MPMIPKPAATRVTLTPSDGEPLALFATPVPAWAMAAGLVSVELAHDYPDLAVAAGWRVAARGFAGTVAGVDGRTLTVEVDP